MPKIAAAALALTALSATPALAEKMGRAPAPTLKVGTSAMLPPEGYKGQWWTAPNRCEYSRAGRPGEVVWYLIINSAHKKCARYIVQRGFSDAY